MSSEADSTPSPTPTADENTSAETETGTDGTKTDAEEESTKEDTNNSDGTDEPTATDEDSDGDSEDDSDDDESFDSDYEETGMPGTVDLTTPDYLAVPTPMFEIGEEITLGWKYSNDTKRPPKKISICGRFPKSSGLSSSSTSLCDWDIAVNISGSSKKYVWNTVTKGAPGIAFVASSGYLMYIYDSDYGVSNARPGAGRIVPSQFWFNMYNSRYNQTNQGIPLGYDPSPAPTVAVRAWALAGITVLGIFGVLA
ncbi:hypothetical protein H4R20_003013 [Coemansia guatemalensis]|uniref:DUF7137 domain-containing protein n=1 Tax=Coemansia guatemalensis TaxID=2761395 RepID=A0A9W8I2P4_9FUNG|nr:hypothetical protein H4R20_003013 [Coemansia guatemalensis]